MKESLSEDLATYADVGNTVGVATIAVPAGKLLSSEIMSLVYWGYEIPLQRSDIPHEKWTVGGLVKSGWM